MQNESWLQSILLFNNVKVVENGLWSKTVTLSVQFSIFDHVQIRISTENAVVWHESPHLLPHVILLRWKLFRCITCGWKTNLKCKHSAVALFLCFCKSGIKNISMVQFNFWELFQLFSNATYWDSNVLQNLNFYLVSPYWLEGMNSHTMWPHR